MNLIERKRLLRKIIKKDGNLNSAIILIMLNNNTLDSIIEKLDNQPTKTNTNCLVKKGYLTSEEQLIEILHHILFRFNVDFWYLKKYGNFIVESVICYEETLPLLLSKKYLGDNSFISFYDLWFKKVCIINFIKILKTIDCSEIICQFLQDYKINPQNFNLNDIKDVNKLYEAIRIICLCNCNEYGLLYLFDTHINENTRYMFQIQIEQLLEKTYQLKELAQELLKNM